MQEALISSTSFSKSVRSGRTSEAFTVIACCIAMEEGKGDKLRGKEDIKNMKKLIWAEWVAAEDSWDRMKRMMRCDLSGWKRWKGKDTVFLSKIDSKIRISSWRGSHPKEFKLAYLFTRITHSHRLFHFELWSVHVATRGKIMRSRGGARKESLRGGSIIIVMGNNAFFLRQSILYISDEPHLPVQMSWLYCIWKPCRKYYVQCVYFNKIEVNITTDNNKIKS